MLLQPRSRFFLRHELRFRAAYKHGLPLPFHAVGKHLDVQSVLQTAIKAGKADLVLKSKDIVRLTTLDLRLKAKLAILLFRRSDPDAATPIFENEKTRALRRSDKKPDEAVALSAHLFVRLGDVPDAAHPTYKAILEEVPGLSRTYIQALMANLLRDSPYEYTDKRGESKETHSVVDFHGLKSEKVGGALKNSTIPYVTLVRPGSVAGLDTEGMVVPKDERLKLEIRAKPENTLKILNRIKAWAPTRHWKDVLVEVDMPENRKRLVSIAREADAADILFVRSVPIDVQNDLDPCTDKINEELVSKAQALFAADDK
jgi:hypothetical protein